MPFYKLSAVMQMVCGCITLFKEIKGMSNKWVFGTLAFGPSVLALGGVLNLTTPAHAFEVERTRGSNKDSRIVRTDKAKAAAPKVKVEPQSQVRRSPIFVRGNHGAQKIGPQGGGSGPTIEYKGFPKLERRGPHGAVRIVND